MSARLDYVQDAGFRLATKLPEELAGSLAAVGTCQWKLNFKADTFSRGAWQALALKFGLTCRELQILQVAFEDKTEVCIARELGISKRTVHTHMAHLHHKLGAQDRAQLILHVMSEFMALGRATPGGQNGPCAIRLCADCPLDSRSKAG